MCNESERLKVVKDETQDDVKAKTAVKKRRRAKRDKEQKVVPETSIRFQPKKKKKKSKALQKHGSDSQSGGIEALLPSLVGVIILVCALMAKMGFRGRASVAGIDLGTTNSVICVQQQTNGVGEIDCIEDPSSGSRIIPSVVSFLEPSERPSGPSSKTPSLLRPHPSWVVVGHEAKLRIDSHPHHTLYNAKRVLGRPKHDKAVDELQHEVEFAISTDENEQIAFRVPQHDHRLSPFIVSPQQVGSYIINHLMKITETFLGHDNVKSAVIAVPAKFSTIQRQATAQAFKEAGVKVTRVLEEPTAAALAYGLHKKEGIDFILVYDFGGGTLDVSMLHVSDGFVDVMGSDGDDRLGGADFDAVVAHQLLQQPGAKETIEATAAAVKQLSTAMEERSGLDFEDVFSNSCKATKSTPLCTLSSFHTIGEQLKIELSSTNSNGAVNASCLGLPDASLVEDLSIDQFCTTLVAVDLKLTAQEFDAAIQPLLARSILPVTRLMRDLQISDDNLHEVVMVGGTTRMPQIRELVSQALPRATMNTHIDPDITVAYGAASVVD